MRSWPLRRFFVPAFILIAIIFCLKWISASEKLSAVQSALRVQMQMQNLLYGIIGDHCINRDIIAKHAHEKGINFVVKQASEVSFPIHVDFSEVSKVIVLELGQDVDWSKSEGIHLYFSLAGCLLNGV